MPDNSTLFQTASASPFNYQGTGPRFSTVSSTSIAAPFSPTDISGCVCWWDASDTATITSSGGLVSQWNDKSGSGFHLTQPTGTKQPTTGTRTQNSLNVIDFDGTTDIIINDSITDAAAATIFFVIIHDTLSANEDCLFGNSGDGGSWYINNSNAIGFDPSSANYVSSTTVSLSTAHILTLKPNEAAAPTAWVDSTAVSWASGSGNGSINGPMHVGGRRNDLNTDRPWDGIMGEVIRYNVALTDPNRTTVAAYLKAKWNTP